LSSLELEAWSLIPDPRSNILR